ncbi:ALK and LTK ligand 2-like isoform X2 [Cololabis saira]|uniref:ALK and LTK ligand 2-like isoform X2 n=1 Tax=Cololabis saira TaxID=129043 RepID=UPI002AD3A7DA|nr:ALK and LTK ligand 2-like isoform X2 [Cololabis saira]
MSGPRRSVIIGLMILMCAMTDHCSESAPSTGPTARVTAASGNLRRMAEIVRHVESRGRNGAKTEAPSSSRPESSSAEHKDARNRTEKGNHAVVVCPSQLRMKEKFIIHLTGPLYFSPKCRKNVYRLYHHTRDCTIPAYFKRCARLLTRLAGSPQCTEG